MAVYEKIQNVDNLPLYKKFIQIDGREALANYVLLVKVANETLEFHFNSFENLGEVSVLPESS